VFDVGETLVDESRLWTEVAKLAGVPSFTLCGVLGALIERDEDHGRVWDVLGVARPESRASIEWHDLYPDALECVAALQRHRLTMGIAGNQPRGIESLLRAAGLNVDFIGSSAIWGVAKPDRAFFARVVREAQVPAEAILYVGDRLDNDVLPARAAGMRTVHIRRGPWGYMHAQQPQAALADLRVDSLYELASVFD
jgi:FMN phosphatase YigB (HAD superfamily)